MIYNDFNSLRSYNFTGDYTNSTILFTVILFIESSIT